MKKISHKTAKASHYDNAAQHYDIFNEKTSEVMNKNIEHILKKYKVKSVLDLTCGTGSQVFWLTKRGFEVVGADINANMLKVAKSKARKEKKDITFLKGDMRTIQVGQFDAVISIFNAIGHLSKSDFEKAMRNVAKNLKKGGYYIFDINNLNYLQKDNNITSLTIDWQKREGDLKLREIQYSTIDHQGILASFTTSSSQKGTGKPKISTSAQTLQIYSAKQLKEMLLRSGFKVVGYCGIDGSKFIDTKTHNIITIAKKV